MLQGPGTVHAGSLSELMGHLNGAGPFLKLLVTPVIFQPDSQKVSCGKSYKHTHKLCSLEHIKATCSAERITTTTQGMQDE